MPSLHAFNRNWNIASDDFVFPCITEATVRLTWFFFGIAVFIFHFPLQCSFQNLTFYFEGLILVNGVTAILAMIMALLSARGTIMNTRKRRHVSTMLYIRLPIFIFEIIWNGICTVLAFRSVRDDEGCNFVLITRIAVVLEWLPICIVFIIVFAVFHGNNDIETAEQFEGRVWRRRLRIFKIRQDALMRAAIDDLANLFASFFYDTDLVISDIVAGLLLVIHSPVNNVYPPLHPAQSDEHRPWMNLHEAHHFFHYATCVYGWPTYLMHNFGPRHFYKLFKKLRCCGNLSCDRVLVVEDNCCFCNTSAFLLSAENKNIDLFFVSFRNRLYEVPFVVLADHESHSIVVAIRGSCSPVDLITDLCLDDEILSVDVDTDPILREDTSLDGNGEIRVHRGMFRSARYVFDTLRKHNVLEDMQVLNPTYKLVLCGHSLGAGVASLLTLFLKQKYPDVRCYAYCPPGCVISDNGQAEMEQHVMSIVVGDDVVSRISYQSMYQMREKVQHELVNCQRPKHEILIQGVFTLFFTPPWQTTPLSGLAADRSNLIDGVSPTTSYGTSYSQSLQTAIEFPEPLRQRIQLYVPGKVFYIGENTVDGEEILVQQWIDHKCLKEIKLSASAFTDHLPKYVDKVLKRLAEAELVPASPAPSLTHSPNGSLMPDIQDL